MTPEELDIAIEALLEERPNEEKPYRRRRNKEKDLLKQARGGNLSIPDSVISDLQGEERKRYIKYVHVYFTEDEELVATVNGWYDDIKFISDELGVPTHYLRLEKITHFDWENDRVLWDGDAHVYEKRVYATARYYDKDMKYLTSRGAFRPIEIGNEIPLEEGVYDYDEEMKETITEIFGSAPHEEQEEPFYMGMFYRDTRSPFDNDTEGKYEKYRLAYEEQDKSNIYSRTIPIEKGNIQGTKRKLIQAMNGNSRVGFGLTLDVDEELMEYEKAVHDIHYEYYW